MAWYKRYRIPFEGMSSYDSFMLYIYEQTNGEIVTLTGAEDPFVTHEDDNNNIFTPIRIQTGYIRIIDETGTGLIDQLSPENNTQKLVRLYRGEWEDDTYRDIDMMWQGFLTASCYSQDANFGVNILEIPVQSLSASLYEAYMTTSVSSDVPIRQIIYNAFTDLKVTPNKVYVVSDMSNPHDYFLNALVQAPSLIEEREIQNEGYTSIEVAGKSYGDILEKILSLYGLCMREYMGDIWLTYYDTLVERPYVYEYSFSQFNQTITRGFSYALNEYDLMQYLTSKGINNTITLLNGKKNAIVNLSISTKPLLQIDYPKVPETSEQIFEVQNIHGGQVFVQPVPRSGTNETFSYYEYQQHGATESLLVGSSTYLNCFANSVIMRPMYDPHWTDQDNLHTGAFPCRFYYKSSTEDAPVLTDGLFLNQQYLTKVYVTTGEQDFIFAKNWCYALRSSGSVSLANGYININMVNRGFIRYNNELIFGEFNSIWGAKPATELYFVLTIGNYEWNGTEWVTHSGDYHYFTIDFDGVNIKSNKTVDMPVEGSSGWFIPIPVSPYMNGVVTLYILNACKCTTEIGYMDAHSRIISDLSIKFLNSVDITQTPRKNNIYRKECSSAGFRGDESIDLTYGTINGNQPSISFVKYDINTFLQTIPYRGDYVERPEGHLLDRMAKHYSKSRYVLSFQQTDLGVFCNSIFTYKGRKFFGIVKQSNRIDDVCDVTYLEIS